MKFFFKKHQKKIGDEGVTLLLVMSILAGLSSISFAMFNLVFSQLQIAGELADSFVALYAADEGIERLLYEDRVAPATLCSAFGTSCYTVNTDFSSVNAFSGGCYSASLSKSDGSIVGDGVAENTLRVTGQSRCGSGASRFVRRAFQLTYTGPTPGGGGGPPPLIPGLIAHWAFDEGSGLIASDSSSFGNNGTLTNMDPVTDWVVGGVGAFALDFDGTNDYVDAGTNSSLTFSDNFTLSAWIYPTGYHTTGFFGILNGFLARGPASTYNYVLEAKNSTTITFIERTSPEILQFRNFTGIPSLTNKWTHVLLTISGGTATLYIDGSPFSSQAVGTIAGAAGDRLVLGTAVIGQSEASFIGKLDDVQIYDRVLTPAEILDLATP